MVVSLAENNYISQNDLKEILAFLKRFRPAVIYTWYERAYAFGQIEYYLVDNREFLL